jgi:hypothetical protein
VLWDLHSVCFFSFRPTFASPLCCAPAPSKELSGGPIKPKKFVDATPRNRYRALHLSAASAHTSMMAGKDSPEGTDDKMDPDGPTLFGVWKPADGLFQGEPTGKWITFVSSSENSAGFVRVVGGDEGYTSDKPRKFYVPPYHSCEVLGCKIMFTRD